MPETIVITGSARLPANIDGKHIVNYVTIEFEIDSVDFTIVDVCSTLLPLAQKAIPYDALLGNKVDDGIEKAIEQVEKRYFGTTKRAIIDALEDACKWYKHFLAKNSS